MSESITINHTLSTGDCLKNLCPVCFGTGKLKAMQAAMTYDAGTVRYKDTMVKCPTCRGAGVLIK